MDENIKNSILKEELGKTAESFAKEGKRKAELDYDKIFSTLNNIEAYGTVEVHCHKPGTTASLDNLSDADLKLTPDQREYLRNHSSNKTTVILFPELTNRMDSITSTTRKYIASRCIGKTKYMDPEVFVNDVLPYLREKEGLLGEVKEEILATYDTEVKDFAVQVMDIAKNIYPDEQIVHEKERQINKFVKRSAESFVSQIGIELETSFPKNLPMSEDLKAFYLEKSEWYIKSCVNDMVYTISKNLWDATIVYVSHINDHDPADDFLKEDRTLGARATKNRFKGIINKCEADNISRIPFIDEAVEQARKLLSRLDLYDANDDAVKLLRFLRRSIAELQLPNITTDTRKTSSFSVYRTLEFVPLGKRTKVDVPSWLIHEVLLNEDE